MGNAAARAFDDLQLHLSGNMHASVLVKSPQSDTYFRNHIISDDLYAAYHPENDPRHIEVQLFEKLKARFSGSFNEIPNGATILFAARWSPCKQCISISLPPLLNQLGVGTRDLKVKFRFDNYYSIPQWPGNNQYNLWPDNPIAQSNYDKLSKQFPETVVDDTLFDENDGLPVGVRVLRRRIKRSLVFAQRSPLKTSIVLDQFV